MGRCGAVDVGLAGAEFQRSTFAAAAPPLTIWPLGALRSAKERLLPLIAKAPPPSIASGPELKANALPAATVPTSESTVNA